MSATRLQARITTGRYALPVALAVATLCWLLASGLPADPASVPGGATPWGDPAQCLPPWAARLAGYALHLLTGYLLIGLNNTYAIIRTRASAQTSIYLLLMAACPFLQPLQAGQGAVLAFIAALYFLFHSYHRPHPATDLFYAFFFLTIGALTVPKLVCLAPLLWVGAYTFRSLTPRSFMASLLGIGLPLWFLWAHAYFHDQPEVFLAPMKELERFVPVAEGTGPEQWAAIAYVGLLYLAGAGHGLLAGDEDNLRTRAYLRFILLLGLCLMLLLALQPRPAMQLFPVAASCTSILSAHLFIRNGTRLSNLFFIAALALWGLLTAYELWTIS